MINALLEAVRGRLIADPSFAALAGERVFALAAPETVAFPCAVLGVPEAAIPDDAYTPNRVTYLDVMAVGRDWEPVHQMAARAKALFDLQPLTVAGAQVFDVRLSSSAYYTEREGRDFLFYCMTRLVVRYTE